MKRLGPLVTLGLVATAISLAMNREENTSSPSGNGSHPWTGGLGMTDNPSSTDGSGSGHAWAKSLPGWLKPGHSTPDGLYERDQRVYQAVVDGLHFVEWTTVVSEAKGHRAVIPVMVDALAIGTREDRVRPEANYWTAQAIADLLDVQMLTPLIARLIWTQSEHPLTPTILGASPSMASTDWMVKASDIVESKLAGGEGLVGNPGKDWVISQRFWTDPDPVKRHHGANFGFFQKKGDPHSEIQTTGLRHDFAHEDYSQVLRFCGRIIEVDGEERDIREVLSDPELSALVSDEGPLPGWRHPDIPESIQPGEPGTVSA